MFKDDSSFAPNKVDERKPTKKKKSPAKAFSCLYFYLIFTNVLIFLPRNMLIWKCSWKSSRFSCFWSWDLASTKMFARARKIWKMFLKFNQRVKLFVREIFKCSIFCLQHSPWDLFRGRWKKKLLKYFSWESSFCFEFLMNFCRNVFMGHFNYKINYFFLNQRLLRINFLMVIGKKINYKNCKLWSWLFGFNFLIKNILKVNYFFITMCAFCNKFATGDYRRQELLTQFCLMMHLFQKFEKFMNYNVNARAQNFLFF